MLKLESQLINLRLLDELAAKTTVIHQLHPCTKLLVTLSFILVLTSFAKYEIAGLIPLFLYPITILSLAGLPLGPLLKRLAFTMPFVLFIGIFNPLFDHTPAMQLGALTISGGWLSFLSILLRSILAVSSALLLIATTGMNAICSALLALKFPKVLVIQLLFMYRYLYLLLEEVARAVRAHSLRCFHDNGISYKTWGSLLGQLLIRTLGRAERIYTAMLCRGFNGTIHLKHVRSFSMQDTAYLVGWLSFFLCARLVNIPQWLGTLMAEVYK